MTPILYIGFGALFRAETKRLVTILLLFSAALMFPTRDADFIGITLIAEALILGAFAMEIRRKPNGEAESLIAAALSVAPALVLIGREMFYTTTDVFSGSASALFASFFLAFLPALTPGSKHTGKIKQAGFFFSALTWIFFANAIVHMLNIPTALMPMLTVYPVCIATLLLVNKKSFLYGIAAVGSFVSPAATFGHPHNLFLSFVIIVAGLVVLSIGFSQRNKVVFKSGIFTSAIGFWLYGLRAVIFFSEMTWVSLAVLGILTLLFAAWLEKNRTTIAEWRTRLTLHFSTANDNNVEARHVVQNGR
jgi:hypothetical protein